MLLAGSMLTFILGGFRSAFLLFTLYLRGISTEAERQMLSTKSFLDQSIRGLASDTGPLVALTVP